MARSSTFFTAILWLLGHSIPCLAMITQLTVTHLMSLFEVYIIYYITAYSSLEFVLCIHFMEQNLIINAPW